ncbi:hypothetical protein LWI28_004390 [Acer negundo]|uniref:Cell wall hydroxyproline-rich glycoprotein n=1 Tax=Acer negundo TaxID=4023 RepID=A0AAD5NZC8_ACENE|nr:hypothetical protein LWI28_004390 [Acer negundo]KAK4855923.1 hypothetical protein QYF36_012318 [Acer negundo]
MIDHGMLFMSCIKMKIINSLITILILLSLGSSSHATLHHPLHDSAPPPKPVGIQNPRLAKAYIALAALKHAITSDPHNFTSNWCGPDVCNYKGVYCAPAPDDPHTTTVAGVDLNNADIAGTLPSELCLLSDLALFHINSNRFCGQIPDSLRDLNLLHELDLSNNQFDGPFPPVLLCIPSLKFLDVRYNKFTGDIPSELFDLKLDALFINNNKFKSSIPKNIGNSPVSVLVLANNGFKGCIPSSLKKMAGTLDEVILSNSGLTGCLSPEIALLKNLTVLDISSNKLVGSLPESISEMKKLEQLNVADNKLSGEIPNSICSLPRLENFTYSFNFFCSVPETCLKLPDKDDKKNCIPGRPLQRSPQECKSFYSVPVDCGAFGCFPRSPPPPPPPPPPPHHYPPPPHYYQPPPPYHH